MSIEAVSYALNLDVGDPTRKLLLIGFANHAHRDGTGAWPAVQTVADYAGCSKRTAQRHIAVLIEQGFIREGDQQLVAHLRADRRPTVYDVALNPGTQDAWARGDNLTPRDEARGDTGDADGVTDSAPRGDKAVSPEPSVEPSVEPPSLRSGAPKATRIPDDFVVTERMKDWWRRHPEFHGRCDPVAETEAFIDFHKGKGTRWEDWTRAWYTWIRNAATRHGSKPVTTRHRAPDSSERVADFDTPTVRSAG